MQSHARPRCGALLLRTKPRGDKCGMVALLRDSLAVSEVASLPRSTLHKASMHALTDGYAARNPTLCLHPCVIHRLRSFRLQLLT